MRLDLTGKRFGRLTVLSKAESLNGRGRWRCECDCGNEIVVITNRLTSGITKSCGCLRIDRNKEKAIDLTGKVFGELTALYRSEEMWVCRCSCGKEISIHTFSLTGGHYKSCGCKRVQNRNVGAKKHLEADRVEGTRKSALKSKLHASNKSGVKGVRWMENKQKWQAYIGFQGKQISLGHYTDKIDAIRAREKAEEKYHKPYIEKS